MSNIDKKNAVELTDEDAAKAAGGYGRNTPAMTITCTKCGYVYNYHGMKDIQCPHCGFDPSETA